tara:strand:+ start:2854 stop:3264 length:411 start_codon:yes stop_codon:yes gene_type:complete
LSTVVGGDRAMVKQKKTHPWKAIYLRPYKHPLKDTPDWHGNWLQQSYDFSTNLPDTQTHGLATTLEDIDTLCWNQNGTLAVSQQEQEYSQGDKTPLSKKTLIRGRKPIGSKAKREGGRYNFTLLETAWGAKRTPQG